MTPRLLLLCVLFAGITLLTGCGGKNSWPTYEVTEKSTDPQPMVERAAVDAGDEALDESAIPRSEPVMDVGASLDRDPEVARSPQPIESGVGSPRPITGKGPTLPLIAAESASAPPDEKASAPRRPRRLKPVGSQPGSPANLRGTGFELTVGRSGVMRLGIGQDEYIIGSRFSYPGVEVGFNALARVPEQSQTWQPKVEQVSAVEATIQAQCPSYAFLRTVRVEAGRVHVFDQFTNTGEAPVGILIRHAIASPERYATARIGGDERTSSSRYSKANPTVFLRASESGVGFLAEDNILRLQMDVTMAPTVARIQVDHFALDRGQRHTFAWTLYPCGEAEDYFSFINRARRDWQVTHSIGGPWEFMRVQWQADLFSDVRKLADYLARKRIDIVALSPWIGFENIHRHTGQLVEREELKQMLRPAIEALRAVNPDIKVTGGIESFPMPLALDDVQTLLAHLPEDERAQGFRWVDRDFVAGLPSVQKYDLEDAIQNRDGKILTLVYYRNLIPEPDTRIALGAVCTYPAPGNAQHERLMDQARFLLEEIELDGLYVDSFNFAWGNEDMTYSHHKWDGTTVDIDPETGQIAHKYLNTALVGGSARAELIRYCLDQNKVFVANTYPSVRETQNLGTYRFTEAEWAIKPLELAQGQMPPVIDRLCAGHLSTPIGLGLRVDRLGDEGLNSYAHVVMKTVITHLRNGSLYYYYDNEIPESGPGAGEYGAINHMFPITPVQLGAGYVVGRERIVTAVSGTFAWPESRPPEVLGFDINGRAIEISAEMAEIGGGWEVQLKLEDWENIAVIQ